MALNVDQLLENAQKAAIAFKELDQERTDRIVKAVYQAGFDKRISLAKHAIEETKLGILKDKVIKNIISTRYVYEDIKNVKTVGVIRELPENGVIEIAQPLGPIVAITPITNPTSTVMFKILIALKSRNPIIIRPHGSARRCSIEAAKICYEAAIAAGAPEYCIQWVKMSTKEETIELMSHRKTALILATGSVELVRAAYRSGNPAFGVGPGNVPVYIGKSADVPFAVEQILMSKTFDNGTVCASEQAVVANIYNVERVKEEFKKRKAYFLKSEEISKLEDIAFNRESWVMSVEVIGQPAVKIARMAKIDVPEDTSLLMAPLDEGDFDRPVSHEILAPILAFYVAQNFKHGIELCRRINVNGGLGHTASIFSQDEEKIDYFAQVMNAGRILVNTPASHGALGGTYNALKPSFTLACGSGGKNITTDNISAKHLINIQRIARRKVHPCFESLDSRLCMDEKVDSMEMEKLCHGHYSKDAGASK